MLPKLAILLPQLFSAGIIGISLYIWPLFFNFFCHLFYGLAYISNGIAEINTDMKLDLFLIKFYVKALKKNKQEAKTRCKGNLSWFAN